MWGMKKVKSGSLIRCRLGTLGSAGQAELQNWGYN